MRSIIISCSLLIISFLYSCAPKVSSIVNKTYPALGVSDEVIVIQSSKYLPENAEKLASVKIGDSGFSINCDSMTVIEVIKNKARQIGGNSILITEHKRPSIWGSSCHRMAGDIYRMDEISLQRVGMATRYITYNDSQDKKETPRWLPTLVFTGDIGYGWRTAKIYDAGNPDMKNYLKKLKSGMIWNISGNYFFNDTFGAGIQYYTYSASASQFGTLSDSNQETIASGSMDMDDMITFIGPLFSVRGSANQKWIFGASVSIGYLGYSSKMKIGSYGEKLTGSSAGVMTNLSAEYKFAKNWGVGANIHSCAGVLTQIDIDKNGNKSTVKFDRDNYEGLGNITLSLGVRWYLK